VVEFTFEVGELLLAGELLLVGIIVIVIFLLYLIYLGIYDNLLGLIYRIGNLVDNEWFISILSLDCFK
jgi:hypothetical protein